GTDIGCAGGAAPYDDDGSAGDDPRTAPPQPLRTIVKNGTVAKIFVRIAGLRAWKRGRRGDLTGGTRDGHRCDPRPRPASPEGEVEPLGRARPVKGARRRHEHVIRDRGSMRPTSPTTCAASPSRACGSFSFSIRTAPASSSTSIHSKVLRP